MQKELTVWVCLSKSGKTLVFSEEPVRNKNNGEWTGPLYVNYSMYEQINRLISQSQMTPKSDPEQIVFTVK